MIEKIVAHARRFGYHLGLDLRIGKERFRMRGYYASRLNYSDYHEPFMGVVLQRYIVPRPGAFIDVGVNVGQTLMKVLSVDRSRRYIGFEPQIGCSYFVDQFIRLNGLRDAMILPIALSDSNHILTLYSHGQYDEMATTVDGHDVRDIHRLEASRVQARIGDEVLRELGVEEICAIKIDVEGAELNVLNGLLDTLRVKRPPLIFEVLPNFHGHDRIMHPEDVCAKNNYLAGKIYSLLDGLGYSIFQIDSHGDENIINHFELDDRDGFIGGNYIATARERGVVQNSTYITSLS